MSKRQNIVMGHHAAPARITHRAVRLVALYIGLPIVLIGFLLDVGLRLTG
jgi:hypothetical protein